MLETKLKYLQSDRWIQSWSVFAHKIETKHLEREFGPKTTNLTYFASTVCSIVIELKKINSQLNSCRENTKSIV